MTRQEQRMEISGTQFRQTFGCTRKLKKNFW